MRILLFLAAWINCWVIGFAQVQLADPLINECFVESYAPTLELGEKLFLPMKFGRFELDQVADLKVIDSKRILKVEVVCTDFPRGIDLSKLNQNRIVALQNKYPILKGSKSLTYHIIKQRDFGSEQEARALFHGVVITYLPKPSKKQAQKEWHNFDKILRGEAIQAYSELMDNGDQSEDEFIDDECSNGSLSEQLEDSVAKINTTLSGTKGYSRSRDVNVSSSNYELISKELEKGKRVQKRYFQMDSSLIKTLDRVITRPRTMIIVDVTSSMYPYVAQTLMWLKLNMDKGLTKQYVFFNDGDFTKEQDKVLGEIGGIYISDESHYLSVKSVAALAMKNGVGGLDMPENNIEAIIKGIDRCPECDEVVMIADNNAKIKDYQLSVSITKPIKIILCGVYGPLTHDYLNVAKLTKGSVHTMENDLTSLAKKKEGERFKIGMWWYVVKNGRILHART